MRNIHRLTGTLAALGLLTLTSFAAASSHKEAPAISNDPAADNTDLWAWTDNGPATTVWIVASYSPLEEPNGGPNFAKFSDSVLYQIHVARDDKSLADVVTYNIQFTTTPFTPTALTSLPKTTPGGGQEFFAQLAPTLIQTYTVYKIVAGSAAVQVATANIGPRTDGVVYGPTFTGSNGGYSKGAAAFMNFFTTAAGSDGTIAWAGQSDDGFYVDLARVFDLAAIAAPTSAPPATLNPARNGTAGYNVHTIALAIPATVLNGGTAPVAGTSGNPAANDPQTLGIWASASRRKVRILRANGSEENFGPWTQVSRLGVPLVNEAVIGLQDKDRYNRTTPATDLANFGAYVLNPVVVQDANAVGIYTALGVSAGTVTALGTNRTDLVDAIGANDVPAPGSHNFGGFLDEDAGTGTTIGDVLRLDLGFKSGFPNGRPLAALSTAYQTQCYLPAALCASNQNQEQTQVTDTILTLALTKGSTVVSQGATHNDINYQQTFPFVAPPWAGSDEGHGCLDTDTTFPCRQ
jgi:Domain of unknown function (DUF4331)